MSFLVVSEGDLPQNTAAGIYGSACELRGGSQGLPGASAKLNTFFITLLEQRTLLKTCSCKS